MHADLKLTHENTGAKGEVRERNISSLHTHTHTQKKESSPHAMMSAIKMSEDQKRVKKKNGAVRFQF